MNRNYTQIFFLKFPISLLKNGEISPQVRKSKIKIKNWTLGMRK